MVLITLKITVTRCLNLDLTMSKKQAKKLKKNNQNLQFQQGH